MPASAKLSEDQARRLKILPAVVGPGLIIAIIAGYSNKAAFWQSWWAGTLWMTAAAVGAQVFVLCAQGVQSRSTVVMRRPMEWIAGATVYSLVHWICAVGTHDYTLSSWWPVAPFTDWRGHWFRQTPFGARAILLVLFVGSVGSFYAKLSSDQDTKPDAKQYGKAKKAAWPLLVWTLVFGVVATTDWILGLDVADLEFSQVPLALIAFLGLGVAAALAIAGIITAFIQRAGVAADVVTVEERVRLARWIMLGLALAAVAIAIFALGAGEMWRAHWTSSEWMPLTIASAAIAAVAIGLLAGARKLGVFATGAVVALFATFLVAYQIVMPLFSASIVPSWAVVGGLTGSIAIVWIPVSTALLSKPVYPVNDPLLKS